MIYNNKTVFTTLTNMLVCSSLAEQGFKPPFYFIFISDVTNIVEVLNILLKTVFFRAVFCLVQCV